MTIHVQQLLRPLLSVLLRNIFFLLFVSVCLIGFTHVDCSSDRLANLRGNLLARRQEQLHRQEVFGRDRKDDLPADHERFNTDVAELQARQVIRHSQQFLPLRLRDGYTGLNNKYSGPRITADSPVLFLAIGIVTAPTIKSRALRDSIRQTWGQATVSMHRSQIVMYRFFAAIPPETSTSTSISFADLEDEAIEHGDMIILGHDDSFSTISKKTIAIMTWGSDLCGAYFTAKTDDDTFVHIPSAVSWLLKHGLASTMFAGLPVRPKADLPRRELGHKDYVSPSEFPFDKGGCYHVGAFFVASRDVASHIGALRKQPTYVWNRNDYVMAAMRVREVGGVPTTDYSDCFTEMPIVSSTLSSSCVEGVDRSWERNGADEAIVAVHGLSTEMMKVVHQNMERGDDICREVVFSKSWRDT